MSNEKGVFSQNNMSAVHGTINFPTLCRNENKKRRIWPKSSIELSEILNYCNVKVLPCATDSDVVIYQ